MSDKFQTFIACVSPVFPVAFKLADVNILIVSLSGVGSLILIIYKIAEAEAKRRYYKRKALEEAKHKNEK